MSLATVSKGVKVLLVLGITLTLLLMSIVCADIASARPHGIIIGHPKCHKKHKCRRHHRKHHPTCHDCGKPKVKQPQHCEITTVDTGTEIVTVTACGEKTSIHTEFAPVTCGQAGACETLEIKSLEVFQVESPKGGTISTVACGEVHFPVGDEASVVFLSKESSFYAEPHFTGKNFPEQGRICDAYVNSPEPGDTFRLLLLDRSKNLFAEGEITFQTDELELYHATID